MKDWLKKYLSSEDWLIYENGWDPKQQAVRETQFTLGNGLLGSRGVLEEIPYDSYAGTYLAGIYDATASQVTELVNFPNPINFTIVTGGEKLDIAGMKVLEHNRILDMAKGTLLRRTIYSNSKKQRFLYQSMRFLSMRDKDIGVMMVYLTPIDSAAKFTVMSKIDTSISNKGVLTEGRKQHFQINDLGNLENINYVCVRTFEKNIFISYASSLDVSIGRKRHRTNDLSFTVKLNKGQAAVFTKIFSINASMNANVKQHTMNSIRKNLKLGFDKILDRHSGAWLDRWKMADVIIKGSPEMQKAVRFNIYHLLIASPDDQNVSVGARTLSGEGYRGHIFWDAEVFIMPFYIYINPQAAKNMLLYRYARMNAARQIARQNKYKGVMFPWESADSGFDSTPTWYKDFDGSIIRIHTMEREQHITSDIAYSALRYYNSTGDIDFFMRYGLEIIFECARFWASRVEYNKRKRFYEINHVIGPDEFHTDVNNNAFTNAMAMWTMDQALLLYNKFKRKHSREINTLLDRLNLKEKEIKRWVYIVSKMKPVRSKAKKIIEAFDGFFDKKYIPIRELDSNLMPVFPKGLKLSKIGGTQLIKQADTVMLMYILNDFFSRRIRKINYEYYNKRTLHKSSLSPSMYAIAGLESGDTDRAYQYFSASAYADLKNLHGNTADGIHAASCGGTWQVLINGFAGMRIRRGILSFNPKLPVQWKSFKFNIMWREKKISVIIYPNKIKLRFYSKNRADKLQVRVYNAIKGLFANKWGVFSK